MDHLPYLTADLPGIGGTLKTYPDDFVVDEIPAYLPTGSGTHLYVRFEKSGLDTKVAIDRLAKALGVSPREAGWAGLKDRHAVTRQWASFADADPAKAEDISVDSVRILEVGLHGNKLRTGHLRGNRFSLVLRTPSRDVAAAQAIVEVLAARGCPNYYGGQRFGRDNLARAKAWALGGRAPRSRFDRKFLASVLQSAVFNEVCRRRVGADAIDIALDGDVFRKEASGGLFTTEDTAEAMERVRAKEISPTGPMPGPKMKRPTGAVFEAETAAIEALELTEEALHSLGRAAPGTRRPLRVIPEEVEVETHPEGLRLAFTLPAGAYGTVLMREVQKEHER